jgi:hypothetical protein
MEPPIDWIPARIWWIWAGEQQTRAATEGGKRLCHRLSMSVVEAVGVSAIAPRRVAGEELATDPVIEGPW